MISNFTNDDNFLRITAKVKKALDTNVRLLSKADAMKLASRGPSRLEQLLFGRSAIESGSPGLIRTGGRPINSRMLYR